MLALSGCENRGVNIEDCNRVLTEEKIISLAKEVAKSQEFQLEYMDVYYDENNERWNETSGRLREESKESKDFIRQHMELLHNRCYQAVLFIPDIRRIMSGEFWVFVDVETGEIITFCGGI